MSTEQEHVDLLVGDVDVEEPVVLEETADEVSEPEWVAPDDAGEPEGVEVADDEEQ